MIQELPFTFELLRMDISELVASMYADDISQQTYLDFQYIIDDD